MFPFLFTSICCFLLTGGDRFPDSWSCRPKSSGPCYLSIPLYTVPRRITIRKNGLSGAFGITAVNELSREAASKTAVFKVEINFSLRYFLSNPLSPSLPDRDADVHLELVAVVALVIVFEFVTGAVVFVIRLGEPAVENFLHLYNVVLDKSLRYSTLHMFLAAVLQGISTDRNRLYQAILLT